MKRGGKREHWLRAPTLSDSTVSKDAVNWLWKSKCIYYTSQERSLKKTQCYWDIVQMLQFTDLTCKCQLQPSPLFSFKTFSYPPKGNPMSISSHSPTSPPFCPWQPPIYFLSLWICLFWTLPINALIHCMVFCVWLISISIMFPRFIHAVACVSASFFFYRLIIFQGMNRPHCMYPFINWWTSGSLLDHVVATIG